MKKTLSILIIGGALLAAGCSKSKNNPSPASDSYLPVTSGSNWVYNDIIGGTNSPLTVTMTGAKTVFNGKTYYAATSSSSAKGTSTGYFYADNNSYSFRATAA